MNESHRPVHRSLGEFRNLVLDLLDLAENNPGLLAFVTEALTQGTATLRKLLKTFQPKETPSDTTS